MNNTLLPITGLDIAAFLMRLPEPVLVIEQPLSNQSIMHMNEAAQKIFDQLQKNREAVWEHDTNAHSVTTHDTNAHDTNTKQVITWEDCFPSFLHNTIRQTIAKTLDDDLENVYVVPLIANEGTTLTVTAIEAGVMLHISGMCSEYMTLDLLDQLGISAMIHNCQYELVDMNESALQFLGLPSKSSSIGSNLQAAEKNLDLWYPTYLDGSRMPLDELPAAQVIRTGEPLKDVRFGLHFSIGEMANSRWARATGLPQRDALGNLRYALTVFHDETDMYQFEKQSVVNKDRYRSLLQSAARIVWKALGNGVITERLLDWERFTGQQPEDYMGPKLGWLTAIHPEDREPVTRAWRDGLQMREVTTVVNRVRRFDGQYVRMETRGVPLCDEHGRVQEWVGTYTDLSVAESVEHTLRTLNTELEVRIRERTAELARASRFNRLLLNSAGEGIFGLDTKGICTFVNPAAARMLGYGIENLLGKSIGQMLQHEYQDGRPRKPEHSPLTQILEDGRRRRVASDVFWHAGGHAMPVAFTVNPTLNENGVLIGAVVIFQDISERLSNQEALEAAIVDLRRSNAELEQFAYVASHDLQEPLRTIGSYAELLNRRYQGQLDQRADQYLRFMTDAVHRMQSLMQDLLMFAKVGRSVLEPKEIKLGIMLNEVQQNVQAALNESGGRLVWGPEDEQHTLKVHSSLVVQLLTNLVSNAIKFRKPDQPPHVEIRVERSRQEVTLLVRDHGIGIAPEYHERVFAIFQRLHRRDTYEGNGMGLAICRKIAERHGGQLSVSSVPSQGSTFKLILPQTWLT